ncbi:MAG: UDP-N-acetylmuramate dehydrogenase [Schwartzia sp. (in: firmicutes)]
MNTREAYQAFLEELAFTFPSDRILENEPMRKHTTFRVGGLADCLLYPATTAEVQRILSLTKRYALPLTILGNGSNVLVRDKGIRGIVMVFGQPAAYIEREGTCLLLGAGTLLRAAAQYAADHGLTGLEFAAGIPGSVGGAVFMNAGAYDGEMKNVVSSIEAIDEAGGVVTYRGDEAGFGYRTSVFQKNGHIIRQIAVTLTAGDTAAIRQKMAEFNERRRKKQPLEYPSAGSTFKRPTGYFAGTLIEEAGLKGLSVGDAQVSEKHAGFILNRGHATAEDVLTLIAEVQRRVFLARGVELIPEVRVIGEA